MGIDWYALPTPCYVVDESLLIQNLEILQDVSRRADCRILLAQKGFSMYSLYPLIGRYLHGTTASSLFEARLGHEEMDGETHVYSPAFKEEEFDELVKICDHIVFNSFSQWKQYKDKVKSAGKAISLGLRINPEYSEVETDIYNPCFRHSRLGVTAANFQPEALDEPDSSVRIEGLHFHTLCEQNSHTLERTLKVVEEKFGLYMGRMKWINFGGGHHITRSDYDRERLISCIKGVQDRYGVSVYLEPGEAVALNTGYLAAQVLDIVQNEMDIAILDTSASCHMPDVLEMPYRPAILGAGSPGEYAHVYRLAGPTCLAGDVIGDYSFPQPLKPGDRLVFRDMAHYTMVKNNTFNGVKLPSIVLYTRGGSLRVIKQFGYEDFKSRLS